MTNHIAMSNAKINAVRELVDNPTPRIPVAVVSDVSGSMEGEPIRQLREGLVRYREEILADELTRYSAETALITYSSEAQCVSDFCAADEMQIPWLEADGYTDMGAGLQLALNCLENRKAQYRSAGVDYYQPILVVITDGYPNGDPSALNEAIERARGQQQQRKLSVVAVGAGEDADFEVLQKLCVKGKPVHLDKMHFREFFAWLSASVSAASRSMPGMEEPLDLSALEELCSENWKDIAL